MRLQNRTESAWGRLHYHSRYAPISRSRVTTQPLVACSRRPNSATPFMPRRVILPDA
jgi:hypothetical protein